MAAYLEPRHIDRDIKAYCGIFHEAYSGFIEAYGATIRYNSHIQSPGIVRTVDSSIPKDILGY